MSEQINIRDARRLALVAAGLLRPNLVGLPTSVSGGGSRAIEAAYDLVRHFGYLQLDTISVAGARSHAIVLHSRWPRLDPTIGEELLHPGAPVFEYWGHEASWIPLDLYPHFEFRRTDFRTRPWTKRVFEQNPGLDRVLLKRIRDKGPVRSIDLEGKGSGGWWGHKPTKRVAVALWSTGKLAIRERSNFQRTFDLASEVIPESIQNQRMPLDRALPELLYRALAGHGWAQTGTLTSTWRIRNRRTEVEAALARLVDEKRIVPCSLVPVRGEFPTTDGNGSTHRPRIGWIRADHLELLPTIRRLRINPEDARLLSPFDPLISDRRRTRSLFGFDYTIEIFKPQKQRVFGYYSLPILAGEFLIGRVDLKADRSQKVLRVLSRHQEKLSGGRRLTGPAGSPSRPGIPGVDRRIAKKAESIALNRFALAMRLDLE